MSGALVDTNVLLDLYVNPTIYAEVSIGFTAVETLEQVLDGCGL